MEILIYFSVRLSRSHFPRSVYWHWFAEIKIWISSLQFMMTSSNGNIYWPFVMGIHRSPVEFPHKGQWRGIQCFLWFVCYLVATRGSETGLHVSHGAPSEAGDCSHPRLIISTPFFRSLVLLCFNLLWLQLLYSIHFNSLVRVLLNGYTGDEVPSNLYYQTHQIPKLKCFVLQLSLRSQLKPGVSRLGRE